MRIDRLALHEGPRLRVIRLRALGQDPEAFGSTLEETRTRPEQSWVEQVRDLETYLAVVDGEDVGMVRGIPARSVATDAFLLSMWVAPEIRGQGVGEALIARLVTWARAEGFARLVLDVGDHNLPAIGLYLRMGFVPTGEIGHLPPPRESVAEQRMALRLQ